MRPIHLVRLDKNRPAVILTREAVRPYRTQLTIAPITSTVWNLATEVKVGAVNGIEEESVISCDNVTTIPVEAVGRLIGYLQPGQEAELARAIVAAYDLAV